MPANRPAVVLVLLLSATSACELVPSAPLGADLPRPTGFTRADGGGLAPCVGAPARGEIGGSERALIDGPSACSPCDPTCNVSRDDPTDADLPGRSTGLVAVPTGVTIQSTGTTTLPGWDRDSDGDGVPDVADSFPSDGGRTGVEGGIFRALPFGGPSTMDPLRVNTAVTTADVYFLMDTTGSMGDEIRNLRDSLTSGTFLPGCGGGIIGAIRCTIPGAWFGVGRTEDYPVNAFGSSAWGDRPFTNHLDLDPSPAAAQGAVGGLFTRNGVDWPEGQSQALWAIATGNGLGAHLPARTGCAAGRWGYPCFRPDTIPIVILFTDAPYHNGPTPWYDYPANVGGTATIGWPTVVSALQRRSIRVLTVESSGGYDRARSDAQSLASLTNARDGAGNPYVFSIPPNGSGLGTTVVDAIVNLANSTRFDISARAVDNASTPFDETTLVQAISATSFPAGRCAGVAGTTVFLDCLPGTNVTFTVELRNGVVAPTAVPQVFDFVIETLADGSAVLSRTPVRVVVPPVVPVYPPTGSYWRDYDTSTRCAPNERPDWGPLAFTATLPAGTRLSWAFRAAATRAGVASATPVVVDAPPATSPIDVGAALSSAGQANLLPFLRATVTLVSSADRLRAPTLDAFELRYTCVAAE